MQAIRKIKKEILTLKNSIFKTKGKKFRSYSYSQCGEDIIVQYIFNLRGVPFPTYIDIGANDPFFLNNTAIFYDQGCKGINVEANPDLIRKFYDLRPNDINLNLAVGPMDQECDFYVIDDPTLSTFKRDECEKYIATGRYHISKTIKLKITTLQKIIDDYYNGLFPDFLSIDVEGMDLEILKTLDYTKATPKIICVEASEYSPLGNGKPRNELIEFLQLNGYYEYANTNLNAIMVRRDFWFI
jgi:FkbM family methyltransferase